MAMTKRYIDSQLEIVKGLQADLDDLVADIKRARKLRLIRQIIVSAVTAAASVLIAAALSAGGA